MKLVFSLALSLASFAAAQDCSFQDTFDIRGDGSLLLRQFVADDTVTVQLEYAGNAGWLGFAFTEEEVMVPNVAAIGLPDDGTVLKYDLVSRSLAGVTPLEDARQTLTDTAITQNGTHTVLTFTKPLLEENEVSVNAESNQFNWAIGSANTLDIHASRGTATSTFDRCVATAPTDAPIDPPINAPVAAPVEAPTGGPPDEPCKTQRDTANACLLTAGSCGKCINKVHRDIFSDSHTITCTEYEDGICSGIFTDCGDCGMCSDVLEQYFACTMFDLSQGACDYLDCDPPVTAPTTPPPQRLDLEDGELQVVLTADENAGTIKVDMLYSGVGYIAFGFSEDGLMAPGSVAVIALPEDDGSGVPTKWDLSGQYIGGVNQAEENRQTLQVASYFQNETHTGMSFEKLLIEDGEPEVSLTESNFFLYAIGEDNELKIHAKRAPFSVDFSDSSSSISSGGLISQGPSGLESETSSGENAVVLFSGMLLCVLSMLIAF